MITNFFVLSPRGDTVIAKTYRSKSGVVAHERSHTEAFFRKVKFWDGVAPGTPGMDTTLGLGSGKVNNNRPPDEGGGGHNETSKESVKRFGDAPPVFVMPDGYSYMHVKRNGLIFGCATEKNVSPVAVIEVRIYFVQYKLARYYLYLHYALANIGHMLISPNSSFRRLQRYSRTIVAHCQRSRYAKTSSFFMSYSMRSLTTATHR